MSKEKIYSLTFYKDLVYVDCMEEDGSRVKGPLDICPKNFDMIKAEIKLPFVNWLKIVKYSTKMNNNGKIRS